MDSCSGASARTSATHSTGGDNNLVRSVTTLDLKTKTTYKSNKVDLALSKVELAQQEEEIEN